MTKRIWIIDGSYLYKSTPERFDYLRLKNELQTILGITFTESYYFNSRMPRSTPAQLSFNKWLQTAEPIGPQLIVKLFDVKRIFSRCNECQQQSERYIQKGVDVGIVTQIFKLLKRSQVERLTLCAGDSIFPAPWKRSMKTKFRLTSPVFVKPWRPSCNNGQCGLGG